MSKVLEFKKKDKETTTEEREKAIDEILEEVQKANAAKAKKLEEDRKKANERVKRNYRLKK